ncbi:MAG: hypothetical protein KC561_01565 [Myxococcales bacterium]|nr:hypothetical protein [Myxococcales bacterium]
MFKRESNQRHKSKRTTLACLTLALIALGAASANAQEWGRGHGRGGGGWDDHGGDDWDDHGGRGGGHGGSHHRTDISMDITSADHTFTQALNGRVSCTRATGTACTGYVNRDPMVIDVKERMTLEIEVESATVDTVLALVGPSGVFSDDDGGHGTNSLIRATLLPGEYELYMGTFSHHGRGDATITVSNDSTRHRTPGRRGRGGARHATAPAPSLDAACPAGSDVVYLRRGGYEVATGWASGTVMASTRTGGYETGWLPETAQVCVVVEEAGNYNLEVTSSSIDTVLAVIPLSGGRTLYDDDGGSGTLSKTGAYFERGAYLAYVGSWGYGNSGSFGLTASCAGY